jgi:N-acetylmuramoyl-L-alanine amidase
MPWFIWPLGFSRILARIALVTFALTIIAQRALAAPVIEAARFDTTDAVTRISFTVTEALEFRIFTLSDPDRVVIDLSETAWRVPAAAMPRPSGLAKAVRFGQFRPGTARIVIDCAARAAVREAKILSVSATGPHRLVLDLVPASGTMPTVMTEPPPPLVPPSGAIAAAQAVAAGTALGAATPIDGAKLSAFARPLPRPKSAGAPRIVVIDPGHGGHDPGAIGASGLFEKHVTLAAARDIRTALTASGNYKVVLTRNRDTYVRLRDRIAIARRAGADLFLSVHADALRDREVRGLSVYTLSETASDAEAAQLAERENKSGVLNGMDLSAESPEVTDILIDLVQRETQNRSIRLASLLIEELRAESLLLPNTHRFAGFAVLKAPDVPSVLIEMGFLSNRADERLLGTTAYRKQLAGAVAEAVHAYFARIEEARLP